MNVNKPTVKPTQQRLNQLNKPEKNTEKPAPHDLLIFVLRGQYWRISFGGLDMVETKQIHIICFEKTRTLDFLKAMELRKRVRHNMLRSLLANERRGIAHKQHFSLVHMGHCWVSCLLRCWKGWLESWLWRISCVSPYLRRDGTHSWLHC